MKWFWRVFRAVLSALLLLAVTVPAALYVLLSLDGVQTEIRTRASRELSCMLGADVGIRRLGIRPFSRIELRDVTLAIDGDSVAAIGRVSAGIDFWELVRHGNPVVDYALIDNVRLALWRDSIGAPLNVQCVLDSLRSDNPDNRPASFSLALNTLIIRNASLKYDILSAPAPEPGRFDPHHIHLDSIALNVYAPSIANDCYDIHLEHLAASERSGLALRQMKAQARVTADSMSVSGLMLDFGRSQISLEPMALHYSGFDDIARAIADGNGITVRTAGYSTIYPPEFSALAPVLADFDAIFGIDMDLTASRSHAELRQLRVRKGTGNRLALSLRGSVDHPLQPDSAHFDLERLETLVTGTELATTLGTHINHTTGALLRRIPRTLLVGRGRGSLSDFEGEVHINGNLGNIDGEISYYGSRRAPRISATLDVEDFNAGVLAGIPDLGTVTGSVEADITRGRRITGTANADIASIVWKGYAYQHLSAHADMPRADHAEVSLTLADPSAQIQAYAFLTRDSLDVPCVSATATIANVDFDTLNISALHPDSRFGLKMVAELRGNLAERPRGFVSFTNIHWLDAANRGLRITRLNITSDETDGRPRLAIASAPIKGSIAGDYHLGTLPAQLRAIAARFVPSLVSTQPQPDDMPHNVFDFNLEVASTEDISAFFRLPAALAYPASVTGRIDSRRNYADINIDAPFILQGDKSYENTNLFAVADGRLDAARIFAGTRFPTQKGEMNISTIIGVTHDTIDTHIDWTIERRIPLNGTLDLTTSIKPLSPPRRPAAKPLLPFEATVAFRPGTVNFGYETWHIRPSTIRAAADGIYVAGFALDSEDQHIGIDGNVSSETGDTLAIDLRNVQLLPIFETLEIDKAMLGGAATGRFRATGLLGSEPYLRCDTLHVDSIGYNRCIIGDADILAEWNNERRAFYLDADITGLDGLPSRIYGDILPFDEALDLNFNAARVPISFLKPFMEAFASDISGHASGECRLYGTFKEIDLEGDVFADSVRIAIDFTNTAYIATDSVHLRPGRIEIPSTIITDTEGHTARLAGTVGHTFFKEPTFDFRITDADNILAFNGTPAQNPDWYGRIYGSGTAAVYGEPGVVNIEADMATGSGSGFAFVISDRLDAEDYSFITFRDVTPDSLRTPAAKDSRFPESVRRIRERLAHTEQEEASDYLMRISVDITPDAAMTLVMDAATGDEIKAHGNGHIRMTYDSSDDDLRLYGSYSVLSGSYHFTLQDIIIKDFTIKEGSSIHFDGDPYAIRSNLEAYYTTNANLSDLDESFLQDREVARTNVPVHAVMKVNGDIRQPEIAFDLEFPTLTEDTYRKVRSIVSTDDMMNRQIIYLLALNRFYTPDYMGDNTTKGSELFSVASSTISSQLTSLLGKLSDNWSIAPNLRSDRGDFSDVEVDVALSSRLLNNRLLLNGNFGYRDKAMNSNQFVGDFDIEYLLNKRGTWRLKAYNRFNDATYYLRQAATTQGVGIMYRRDFDNLLNFLKPKKSKVSAEPEPADTTRTKPSITN